jgi:hypothetical protein
VLHVLIPIRREVDSLGAAFRAGPAKVPPESPVLARLHDLLFSWTVSSRPQLEAIGVGDGTLEEASSILYSLARLTSRKAPKSSYLQGLARFRSALLEHILPEIGNIPAARLLASGTQAPQRIIPEIPDLPNQLVPNALQGWVPQMRDFLKQNSFDRNVFIMISYRPQLRLLLHSLEKTLVDLGLNPVVAKDQPITDDLYNPIACLLCCSYGVAVFDTPQVSQAHNPNVVYELGMMQLLKRPCVILKRNTLGRMPTDLLNKLYESYSSVETAATQLTRWWNKRKPDG